MGAMPARRRITVDEYQRMGEAGIFHEDDRVELVEGDIIEMSPIGGRHIWCVNNLTGLFSEGVRRRAVVSVQNPVRLSRHSEPQPDVVLLRPRPKHAGADVPTASDVLLLVEVADTSLAYDRSTKLPMYARAGIPEVWIVDLERERVEVYRKPTEDSYRRVAVYGRGSTLVPGAFPDLAIPCDGILP